MNSESKKSSNHNVYQSDNPAIAKAMAEVMAAVPEEGSDKNRPTYHFRPLAKNMGDVNGPIYHNGYYHIFYQFLTPKYWGHARSKDLIYWEYLPIALWPSNEKNEEQCWSGCSIINGKGEPMIFYTSISTGKEPNDYAEQWAALGSDDLMVWKKHPCNPILDEKVHGSVKVKCWRDPFIFEEQGRKFMIIGGQIEEASNVEPVILIYEAQNTELTEWQYKGVFFTYPDKDIQNPECANFFKLGNKWVMVISPRRIPCNYPVDYFVGTFDVDNLKFNAAKRSKLDYSFNENGGFYATNCIYDQQDRLVLWGSIFRKISDNDLSAYVAIPRIIDLDSNGDLIQKPIPEIQKLRDKHYFQSDIALDNTSVKLQEIKSDTIEIVAEFKSDTAKDFGIKFECEDKNHKPAVLSYNGRELNIDDTAIQFELADNQHTVKFCVFIDKTVMEVYVNDKICYSHMINPLKKSSGVDLFALGGSVVVKSIDIWEIKPIW